MAHLCVLYKWKESILFNGHYSSQENEMRRYFLERDAPYNPLCTHDNVVGHSTKYTFYRVTY